MLSKQKPETTRENAEIAAVPSNPSIDVSKVSTKVEANSSLEKDVPPTSSTSLSSHIMPVSDDTNYPTGIKLALLISFMFVGMFLVSLDKLIISTAIPQITNDFNSAGDIGWYGTAYLLTSCAFQLVFGKIYTFFSVKGTFMASVLLFEIGSALCGAAPDSITFIVGRAVAGLGAGGVMSGVVSSSFRHFLFALFNSDGWSPSLTLTPDGHRRIRTPSPQTSQNPGFLWCGLRTLLHCRPSDRWSFHNEGVVALVFLFESPSRGGRSCGGTVLAPYPRPS